MRDDKLWPIDTDDDVERLARHCGWGDNRRYMTPTDYAIWCERMRKFAALAALKGFEGKSVMASFADNTWTFEMVGDYRVGAGRYLIVPLPAAPQPEEAP